jgi:two-component system, cell cycle response regulator CpdR
MPTSRPILVVDDDPTVLGFVERALHTHGFDVLAAPGGKQALRTVFGTSPGPDVLISDIEMPGMSGIELAARLMAARPGLRVILMSGSPGSVALARERPGLVSAVLAKPFTVEELIAAVAAARAPDESE